MTVLSGVVSFVSASVFAIQIHKMKLKVNLATWGMVLVLDVVGLALVILSGNHEPYLQAGWAFAAVLIVLAAWVNRGNWEWGKTETVSIALSVISVAVWLVSGSVVWSLLGYLSACYFSGIPQAKQYWVDHEEARKSTWLWLVGVFGLILTLLGLPNFSPQYSIVPVGFLFLNLIMAWITLRRPATAT